jgi:type I restriction-modification system DNA methylase subunit
LLQLAENPSRERVLNFSFALVQWMGIEPSAGNTPKLLSPQTQKLKDFLAPAPQTVQPQLYRLNAENENIRVRFAVLKKLKKDCIGQLVDNDPGLGSYQALAGGLSATGESTYIPSQPYFIHFVTTPAYDRLVLILNQGDQKRIVTFKKRLTNTQYNKIIQLWEGIAAKSKPEIADLLWKSLDIREVNTTFYKQIKERFDALIGILKSQHAPASENQIKQFTIRLIGRYIFCWFLKEKGIIPDALINKNAIESTENYYQSVLLKLFFQTLNTKVQDRNSLDNNTLFEKIPFLNGGLFDENTEDRLFADMNLDHWLLPFADVLESYDFTVDESSSQYQQVAVDPEMLGRIFENLLASQNEETEKLANQRKAYGAFYTPREIVDYMVTESLKAYCQTQWEQQLASAGEPEHDASLACDLAPGNHSATPYPSTQKRSLGPEEKKKVSDALEPLFASSPDAGQLKKQDKNLLLTFLNQIKILDPACGSGAFPMGILHKLVELHETLGTVKSSYELKKDILSQNIYGVDIMPMAIEIARLRAWLSLVLEEDYKPTDPKHNFGIKPLPNLDFKFVCANSLIDLGLDAFIRDSKGTLHEGFTRKLVDDLKNLETLRVDFFNPTLAGSQKERLKTEFFLRRDIVISAIETAHDRELASIAQKIKDWNPFDDSSPGPFFSPTWMFGVDKGFDVVIGNPPYGAKFSNTEKKILKGLYRFQDYQMDSYLLFTEKALQTAKKAGCIALIIPNPWLTNIKQKKLREFIINQNTILQILHYNKKVFDAIVDTEVVLLKKCVSSKGHKTLVAQVFDENKSIQSLTNQEQWQGFNGEPVNIFLNQQETQLVSNVKSKFRPISDYINFYAGIKPYEEGKGRPAQTKEMMQNRIYSANVQVDKTYRPVLRGKDIERYLIRWHENNWLKYGENLAAPRSEAVFNTSPKLVIRQTGDSLVATIDSSKFLCLNNLHVGTLIDSTVSLFYFLGLLNSRFLNYYYQKINPEVGEVLAEVKKENVEKLPVPIATSPVQNLITNYVERIMTLKSNNQDTTSLEREIDVMVYKLYELTYGEVKTIDPEFWLSEQEYDRFEAG